MSFGNAIITTNYKWSTAHSCHNNGLLTEPESVDNLVQTKSILYWDRELLNKIQEINKSDVIAKYGLDSFLNNMNLAILGVY